MAATGKCHPGGEVLWRRDVPRSLHPESAGTGSGRCRRRQAVARGRPAFPSARTPPGSSGGRSSGRYAGFAGLKVCTELPDSFFRMKGYAGAGWGLIQGGRVAGEPPGKPSGNRWQNRRETAGKPASNLPRKPPETTGKTAGKLPGDRRRTCRENCRKTAGRPLAKLSENCRETAVELAERNCRKTGVELPENRWKTAGKLASNCRKTGGKPLGKPLLSGRKTVGKTAVEPPENGWKTAVEPPENGWKTGVELAEKTAGKPPENRRRTAGRPLENRRETTGKTVGKPLESHRETTGKTAGKPPGNRREKPRFWVTFASLNKGPEWPGRASPASFFGPWGGVAIRRPLFRLNSCTFRNDGVGGTGICGFLDVTKGILGPMTPKSEFHYKATPKGVYTSSDTSFRGVRTPWLLRKIATICL